MHRHCVLLCAALAVLLGPLATPGQAESRVSFSTVRYLDEAELEVSGTITCSLRQYVNWAVTVTQERGKRQAVAFDHPYWSCSGGPQAFTVRVHGAGLARGPATVTSSGYAEGNCHSDPDVGWVVCDREDLDAEQRVRLR